jgi:hypothetical protein
MGHRVGRTGLVLAAIVLVTACSGGDSAAPTSTAPESTTPETTTPALATEPSTVPATSAAASEPTGSDPDTLPELEPVQLPVWTPETRTEELSVAIGETDQPTVQQAVDAYALLDPDMPGATPSDLPPGDGLGTTFTRGLIESVRDRLAPEQREVIDRSFAAPSDDEVAGVVEVDDLTAPDDPAASGSSGFARAGRPGAEQPRTRYLRLLSEALSLWLQHRPDLPHRSAQLALMRTEIDGGGMDAWLNSGTSGPCTIRVSRSFWRASRPDEEIRFYFAHELFHCVQFGWHFWGGLPDWLIEGSADFAAADLLRSRYTPPTSVLADGWFRRTNVGLAGRSYNAWPLFENLRQSGVDPYPALQAMISSGGGAVEDLLALGRMHNVVFRMAWSSHTLRSAGLDPSWQFSWPGSPESGPHDNSSSFGSRGVGTYPIRGVGGYSQVQAVVNISRPVGLVTVTPLGAPLSTHTGERTVVAAEGAPLRLCFEPDGCRCPEGSDSGAIRMLHRDMIFSFAAAAEPPKADVVAQRWDPDKECERPRPRRATSNGDPHLVTFDGLAYDVHALGEVVTSRDPEGGFEVQTRNVPASLGFAVAGTSAVAVSDGQSRVTFTMDGFESEAAVVRVDGVVVEAPDFDAGTMHVAVPDGGTAVVTWPDGSEVELAWTAGWFVTVSAADGRASRLVGLLGSADGDFRNDLLLPDGAAADVHDATAIDSEFVDAWSVDDDTTLFDYADGESPDTFRAGYPDDAVPVSIDAAASDECARALGDAATSHELESCAFDVAATGDTAFVEAYEVVVEQRIEATEGSGETAAVVEEDPGLVAVGDAAPSLELEGTLVAPYVWPIPDDAVAVLAGTISAGDGAVLLARVDVCPVDVTIWVTIANLATGSGTTTTACDPMGLASVTADEDDEIVPGEAYIWMSEGGEYNVVIESDGEEASFVHVDVFADQSPVVVDGPALADGDRTTLSGEADTVVYVLGLDESSYDAAGLTDACVVEAWGAPPPGDGAAWPLGYCGHQTGVAIGYAYSEVPVVVFTRGPDPVDVELTPVADN